VPEKKSILKPLHASAFLICDSTLLIALDFALQAKNGTTPSIFK